MGESKGKRLKVSAVFLGQKQLKILEPEFVAERKISPDDCLFLLECCARSFAPARQQFHDVDITTVLNANFGPTGFTLPSDRKHWGWESLRVSPQLFGAPYLRSLIEDGTVFERAFPLMDSLQEPAVKERLARLVRQHRLDEPGGDFDPHGVWFGPVVRRTRYAQKKVKRARRTWENDDDWTVLYCVFVFRTVFVFRCVFRCVFNVCVCVLNAFVCLTIFVC